MAWRVLKIHSSPMQNRVTIVNDDLAATWSTDYHAADKLAHDTLNAASLSARGYTLAGNAVRIYASQAY